MDTLGGRSFAAKELGRPAGCWGMTIWKGSGPSGFCLAQNIAFKLDHDTEMA